jgi:hypothetical protein
MKKSTYTLQVFIIWPISKLTTRTIQDIKKAQFFFQKRD